MPGCLFVFRVGPASALVAAERAHRAASCRYQVACWAARDMQMLALQVEKFPYEKSIGTALAGVCRMSAQREHRCRVWNPEMSFGSCLP